MVWRRNAGCSWVESMVGVRVVVMLMLMMTAHVHEVDLGGIYMCEDVLSRRRETRLIARFQQRYQAHTSTNYARADI